MKATKPKVEDRCTYLSGFYKGYMGRAEYDGDADLFHGQVLGTRDVITFQGKTIRELRHAFRESVDDYLDFCKQRGEDPERPFSGKFVARISPALHRQISMLAEGAGTSLNSLVEEWLSRLVEKSSAAGNSLLDSVGVVVGVNPAKSRTRRKKRRTQQQS